MGKGIVELKITNRMSIVYFSYTKSFVLSVYQGGGCIDNHEISHGMARSIASAHHGGLLFLEKYDIDIEDSVLLESQYVKDSE